MMNKDQVELRMSARRQLEAPKMPLVDDLPNYISLVLILISLLSKLNIFLSKRISMRTVFGSD